MQLNLIPGKYVGYCQQLLARPMSKRVERMLSRSKVSRSIDRSQEFFSRIKGSFNNYLDNMGGGGQKYLFLSTLRVYKLSTQGGSKNGKILSA